MHIFKRNSGFTLIELLIVVSIMILFSGIGLAYYNQFTDVKKAQGEAQKLVDVLELAKKRSQSGDVPAGCTGTFVGYSVAIDATGYDLKYDCSASQSLHRYLFDTRIINSPSPYTFSFPALNAQVTTTGPVVIRSADGQTCFNIAVNAVGTVTMTEASDFCPL